MRTLVKAAVVGVGLLAGTAATGHAQYYNYYGWPNTYTWSPYNYPGYQTSVSGNPRSSGRPVKAPHTPHRIVVASA